jgi:hypothetical protein
LRRLSSVKRELTVAMTSNDISTKLFSACITDLPSHGSRALDGLPGHKCGIREIDEGVGMENDFNSRPGHEYEGLR